jgi:MarR family transcriptional regulator, organic hydroperoxide resistance regulator
MAVPKQLTGPDRPRRTDGASAAGEPRRTDGAPAAGRPRPTEAGSAPGRSRRPAVERRTVAPTGEELKDFGAALEEMFRAVLRSSGRGVPGGATELTMSQYWVMDALAGEPLTVSEVAAAARVAVPSATRALRALERRGFVERRRDVGEDGRVVTVALTRAGLDVLDEKRAWVRTAQRQLFESLSPAERRTAAGTLSTLSRGIGEL